MCSIGTRRHHAAPPPTCANICTSSPDERRLPHCTTFNYHYLSNFERCLACSSPLFADFHTTPPSTCLTSVTLSPKSVLSPCFPLVADFHTTPPSTGWASMRSCRNRSPTSTLHHLQPAGHPCGRAETDRRLPHYTTFNWKDVRKFRTSKPVKTLSEGRRLPHYTTFNCKRSAREWCIITPTSTLHHLQRKPPCLQWLPPVHADFHTTPPSTARKPRDSSLTCAAPTSTLHHLQHTPQTKTGRATQTRKSRSAVLHAPARSCQAGLIAPIAFGRVAAPFFDRWQSNFPALPDQSPTPRLTCGFLFLFIFVDLRSIGKPEAGGACINMCQLMSN